MIPRAFFQSAGPALAFGFVLTFSSSAGQTYFISLGAGEIRAELGLSHGGFGALYTVATLASAATLLWLGKLADRIDLVHLSAVSVVGLAAASWLMAGARSPFVLAVALFGLRLFGQGMLSHLAVTAMGRWFLAERGRALSVATLGFPVGEALLPAVVAAALVGFDWRSTWLAVGLVLTIALLPLLLVLGALVRRRGLDRPAAGGAAGAGPSAADWTRGEVMRDRRFYVLLPGILAPPFIITGLLFHQVHLVTVKGWTLAGFAACYPLYAGSATAVALGLGWLVDRFGVVRLLPFYLLPLAAGTAALAVGDAPAVGALFMGLAGCTAGGATIVLGALWPELYGTAHLGAIRALSVTLMVFATAVAPGAMGWLLDAGVTIEVQAAAIAAYTLACAGVFAVTRGWIAGHRPPPGASAQEPERPTRG